MEKQKRNQIIAGVLIVIVLGLIIGFSVGDSSSDEKINIGIITDLSGPASYWGESTLVGAEMAQKELKEEGHNVELTFEDAQLSSEKALSSAQKLVNVDGVDGIYAEFNPASTSVGSFVRGKDLLYVYDAAIVSPLNNNTNAYKTYLDYEKGCKQMAEKFKQKGVKEMGILKVNQEYGELCLKGSKEVYGENLSVESYNLGQKDLSTQILKLEQENVGAIINVGFEGDTLNTLRVFREQNINVNYGTVEDTVTKEVLNKYSEELNGSVTFGFRKPSKEFLNKLDNSTDKELSTKYAAALAYTHIKQMGESLSGCKGNIDCASKEIEKSENSNAIGFNGFNNRIANLSMSIKER